METTESGLLGVFKTDSREEKGWTIHGLTERSPPPQGKKHLNVKVYS